MKKLILLAMLTFGMINSTNAQTKEKQVVELKSTNVKKSRGGNPNIKNDVSFCEIKDVPVPKPSKSRGDTCYINVDNWTGYYVKVYVDGDYFGMVSPWGEGDVEVYSGYTTVYCITAGESFDWYATGSCDGYFSYKISVDNSR